MPEKKDGVTATGRLLYSSEHNCLVLDGYELQYGDNIEVRLLGSWIPGQIAVDPGGWYLFTVDHVGIRLRTGLPARFCEPVRSFSWQAAQPQSPNILLVDDDPMLLQALPRTIKLRLPQAHISVSSSSHHALKLLQEQRFDAIVSDIKMPGMDGLALLQKVHELQPETPALLITGHSDHDLAIQALRGGAFDYILKPVERDEFIAALQRALQISFLRQQVEEQQHALEAHARSLEELVKLRTKELEEAHVTKDKVVGLVSRELKAPLSHLREIAHLLRQRLTGSGVDDLVNQGFEDIEQSLEHIDGLVQGLAHTTRIESRLLIAQRQRHNIIHLCRDILEEQAANYRLLLNGEVSQATVDVEVDVEQLRQVYLMLQPYMQASVRRDQLIAVTLQRVNNEIVIAIRDIWSSTGLGVGIYISRKIMEQHGGRLEIQNFPDNHTTIFLILPCVVSEADTSDTTAIGGQPHTYARWTLSRDLANGREGHKGEGRSSSSLYTSRG